MPDPFMRVGKDNYRFFHSYSEKNEAKNSAERLRKEGKLVRIVKKLYKISTGGKEGVYHVYYCISRRRE